MDSNRRPIKLSGTAHVVFVPTPTSSSDADDSGATSHGSGLPSDWFQAHMIPNAPSPLRLLGLLGVPSQTPPQPRSCGMPTGADAFVYYDVTVSDYAGGIWKIGNVARKGMADVVEMDSAEVIVEEDSLVGDEEATDNVDETMEVELEGSNFMASRNEHSDNTPRPPVNPSIALNPERVDIAPQSRRSPSPALPPSASESRSVGPYPTQTVANITHTAASTSTSSWRKPAQPRRPGLSPRLRRLTFSTNEVKVAFAAREHMMKHFVKLATAAQTGGEAGWDDYLVCVGEMNMEFDW
ncbi:hypothetical protein M427DRAFT_53669 [Gonapodya prolifera JEL478]|uniref:Uncharacterized protein n=1 Tax=Gonapodya prolifera (strain JEL478) TaxID=1344416 RepID=A0A139AQF0_GONPJ|nr:hypothetical protein M427DRAFT_53669 [Gonapodya prolifera JEL478]|eukprot:KXS18733.1 hypothetical protein M427DRAFT_53669 [Gonapodya prolifera JEL478]